MYIQEVLNYLHSPTSFWIMLEIAIIILIAIILKYAKKSSFSIMFDFLYEKVYSFFEEILWINEKSWIKTYVTILFFIILFSNFLWIILEILSPIFWIDKNWDFILEHYVSIPTSNINFNIAMSLISILLLLFIQFKNLGFSKFFEEYVPYKWKWYLTFESKINNKFVQILAKILFKLIDIIISLFLWILEIIWLIAKIISLSFRLFWNMISWTILLSLVVLGLNNFTSDLFSINFPILIPVIIYLQEILVALIQAIIFPLLITVFIKITLFSEDKTS